MRSVRASHREQDCALLGKSVKERKVWVGPECCFWVMESKVER